MGHGVGGPFFRDQIFCLTQLLGTWTEAEQVVAVYTLIRKLSPTPAKFLANTLVHFSQDSADFTLENHANDPAWIGQLKDSKNGLTAELLQHFPLLRPTNTEAKQQYLSVIPKALQQAVHQGIAQPALLENARQLLTYSLIHPGITVEERKSLSQWLKTLEEKLIELHQNSAMGFSSNLVQGGNGSSQTDDLAASYLDQSQDEVRWCSSNVDAPPQSPNNSATSSRSSGSESIMDDQNSSLPHPGMKDLPLWLKSLRLHKYAPLLCNLSYEELLSLNEEILEGRGVTKGARHKIVLSVAKLRERAKILASVEKELMSRGSITSALSELKNIIISPFPPFHKTSEDKSSTADNESTASDPLASTLPPTNSSSEPIGEDTESVQDADIPSLFTRVMGKVCTQLLVSPRLEDDSVATFLRLVDKCLEHEAFTHIHTRRLLSWKHQILRVWHPLPPKTKDNRHGRRWSQQYSNDLLGNFHPSSSSVSSRACHRFTNSNVVGVPSNGKLSSTMAHSIFSSVPPSASLNSLLVPRLGLSSLGNVRGILPSQQFLAKRPSLQETTSEQLRPHVTLQRTRSAPNRPVQLSTHTPAVPDSDYSSPKSPSHREYGSSNLHYPLNESSSTDSDITNRLESLCLSMTEHALG